MSYRPQGRLAVTAGIVLLLCGAALLSSGCRKDKEKGTPESSRPVTEGATEDPAVADIPMHLEAAVDPDRLPVPPARLPAEVSVRLIGIRYDAAAPEGASQGNKRGKAAALRRARRLTHAARLVGADFAALAGKYSEISEGARGEVMTIAAGSDLPYAGGAMRLGIGQVSEPIAGEEAYYVVERVEPEEYSSAHILVIFRGAKLAPVGLKRTQSQAKARAEELLDKARSPETDFAVLASRASDSPSKVRGGVIAPIDPDKLLEGFEPYLEALKATPPGEVHPEIVQTPYGFHIIKRLPLEKVLVSHILISYRGAANEPAEPRRKVEARELAARLRRELLAGADFAKLAAEYSDDAASAEQGGQLPPKARGELLPRFEQFAFALKPGEISDLIDTRLGYHIIKRIR